MDSDGSEFSLFLKTEMIFGHLQHQYCSTKTIDSRKRQDCASSLISLEYNWFDTRNFDSFRGARCSCKNPSPILGFIPLFSYAFSSLMNIVLDRTGKAKELNRSAFGVISIPNLPTSDPSSLSF